MEQLTGTAVVVPPPLGTETAVRQPDFSSVDSLCALLNGGRWALKLLCWVAVAGWMFCWSAACLTDDRI